MQDLTNLFKLTFAHTILDTGDVPKYLIHLDLLYRLIRQEDNKFIYKSERKETEFFVYFSKTMLNKLIRIRNKLLKG